jgi:2-polyprenyl-3-methyl-5-hydroxy-6-metoxy-1,4-benzoquinol methylase
MQYVYNKRSLPELDPARLGRLEKAASWLVDELRTQDFEDLPISAHGRDCLERVLACLDQTVKKYVHILAWGMAAEGPEGSEVFVDYGGGHGVLACLARAAGFPRVIYDDIFEQNVRDAHVLAHRIGCTADDYVCGDIRAVRESLGERVPSSCMLVSINVIEHIYDLGEFLLEAGALSTGRMTLVLSTSANPLNAVVRRRHYRQHREWEFSDGPHESSGPMDSVKAFRSIRREIIRDCDPSLSPAHLEALVSATRGLRQEDIERCVRQFRQTNRLPDPPRHPTNTCDPVTGNWQERLLDIDAVCHDLRAQGFSTEVLGGYYNDTASHPAKRAAARLLNHGISLLGGRHGAKLAPCFMFCAARG